MCSAFMLFIVCTLIHLGLVSSKGEARSQPSIKIPFITSCCNITHSYNALVECVNHSAISNMKLQVEKGHDKVGIVTFASRDIWDYVAYSMAINEAYAEQNGYAFVFLHDDNSDYDGTQLTEHIL